MKIRTNFVTNSSSYSSAEIKIDNPVLLEILKKYRKLGAFMRKDDFDYGFSIGNSERDVQEWEITSSPIYTEKEATELLEELDDTPIALYISEEEMAEIYFAPDSIEDVVNRILDVIVDDNNRWKLANPELFKKCENELKARADEINRSYVEVFWEARNESGGEFEPEEGEETSWEFHYEK